MLNKSNKEEKLRELFFKFPSQKLHSRGIARMLKISTPTVSRLVSGLVREGFLLRKKTKIMDVITANLDSEKFRLKKRLYNLESLYKSSLVSYLKRFYPGFIVLFGSYSRGEDVEKSDIDLAVPAQLEDKKIDTNSYEKKLKRKINIHYIDLPEVSEEFKNSLANGIVLEGYLMLK